MTRHHPSNRHVRRQKQPWNQQPPEKKKGWYCKKHDAKYLCNICGDDNKHDNDKKYYFIDSPITFSL